MTENDKTMTDDERTLGGMDHTNPYTGRVFGATQTYSRGRTVAADGGEDRPASDATPDDEGTNAGSEEPKTLADVSHTPPGETEGAQRAYDRGVRHE